jgi:hypothetical protein
MPWRKVKGNPSDYQYIEYNKQQFKVRWNVDAPYNLFRIWAVPSPNYYGLNLYTRPSSAQQSFSAKPRSHHARRGPSLHLPFRVLHRHLR